MSQQVQVSQPAGHRRQWIAGGVVLALTLCWCLAAACVICYAGDYMIGFHPLLLMLPLYGAVLLGLAIGACVTRKWRFAAMTCVSALAVGALFFLGYRIGIWAWAHGIRENATVNEAAVRQAGGLPELTDDTVMVLADDGLPVLAGFRWYCEHHIASPGGAFRAFRYRGVAHVRIQKIRGGYRGVAFAPSPAERGTLEKDAALTYETAVGDHWLIWRTR